MRRIGRVVCVAAVVLAQAVLSTAPASATTLLTTTFVGTLTIGGGGLGFPCTTGGVPSPNCPPAFFPTVIDDPKGIPTVQISPTGGNVRPFSHGSTVCADTGANLLKASKPPAQAGPCSVTASGSVVGWCGLLTGGGTGTYIDSAGQVYSFSFRITAIASMLILTGEIVKHSTGRRGNIHGIVQAVPDVATPGAGSCLNKTGSSFQLVGTLVVKIITA